MSRSGRIPIEIPESTNVTLSEGYIVAKGKLGELKFKLDHFTDVKLNDKSIIVKPKDQSKRSKEMWGTVRSRIVNLIQGVSEGFSKNLLLNGVGYKAILKGKVLELNLGYSHPINFDIPEDITITVKKPTEISVFGSDKQKVGQIASNIRSFRKPEPYKGKGIKYEDEFIRRKEGKKKW